MITKITKANQARYQALFAKAGEALALDAPITSLEEYFAGIKELANIDPLFTVLPLDEEPFAINADTREITVPAAFKKSGLSVQGDEIAEIVYFSIDRFFDAQDLAHKDIHIVIQWETVPAKGGVKRSGLSSEFVRDITTLADEHKILFGWPITSEITKEAGQIKFAVRFYQMGVGADGVTPVFKYSMSTLPATANIAASLDTELLGAEAVIVDSTKDIINRFVDSEGPTWAGKPNAPIYVLNMLPDQTAVFDKDGDKCVDLEEGKKEFVAEAINDGNTGVLTYSWFKKTTADGAPIVLGAGVDEYVATADTAVIEGKTYYKLEGEKYVPAVATGDPSAAEVTLYELRNKYDASTVGYYYVEATTRVGLGKATTTSDVYRIPGPGVVTASAEDLGLLTDGKVTLTVTAASDDVKDTLVYTWKQGDEAIEGAETATYDVVVDEADRAAFDQTFKASVKAIRNGAETEAKEFAIRVVDSVAHEPTVTPEASAYVLRKGTAAIKATIDATAVVSDEIEYQLIKAAYGENEEVNDRENDVAVGEPVVSTDKTVIANVKVTEGGRYYFKVTNRVATATPAIVYSTEITVA